MYQNCSELQVKMKEWTQEARGAGQQGAASSARWVVVGFSGGRERVTQVRLSLRELSGKLLGCGGVAGPWCHREATLQNSSSLRPLRLSLPGHEVQRRPRRWTSERRQTHQGGKRLQRSAGRVTDTYINNRYIISCRAAFDLLCERSFFWLPHLLF